MSNAIIHVRDIPIGSGAPLALIAGPCVIESEELCLQVAKELREITARLGIPFIFKSSFDKANRTSVESFRGPGIDAGLDILARVRSEVGVPVLTDVHTVEEAEKAGEVVDCIQIPAFLCRQTDLLVAAGSTGKPVNVKKGQFLAPEDMESAARKVESAGGGGGVFFTERGTSFGYRYLVVDFQAMAVMKGIGRPVVFDATHSVQTPSSGCGVSGGDRRFAPLLARAAAAVGIDALFMEVHPHPEEAKCDGPNSIVLSELESVLQSILAVDRAVRETR